MGNIDHFGNVEMNHLLIAKALSVCVCVCVCVCLRMDVFNRKFTEKKGYIYNACMF